jgi:hypothetical protein
MTKDLKNRVLNINKEIKLISLRDDDFIIDVASYQERILEDKHIDTATLRNEDVRI